MKNLILFLFLIPVFAAAQQSHTVQPKETLYSLARKYNVHPRELAAYNNVPVTVSLSVGQVIKIPAKTTMAPLNVPPPEKTAVTEAKEKAEKKEPAEKKEVVEKVEKKEPAEKKEPSVKPVAVAKKEISTPIYHKVGKKETLYHISKLYDNVSIDDIKKWNHLTGDGLSEGANLIVGYSKGNAAKQPEVVEKKEVVEKVEKPAPAEKKEVVEKVQKKEPAEKKEPIEKKEPVKQEEVREVAGKNFGGGQFKSLYDQQVAGKSNVAEEKGPAGIFKSTSGWEDGKYYCLTNTAPAGSIVKITNPANQKFIYAKVLDLIPDLKQNAGMIVRISSAGASELGAGTDNFESTINY